MSMVAWWSPTAAPGQRGRTGASPASQRSLDQVLTKQNFPNKSMIKKYFFKKRRPVVPAGASLDPPLLRPRGAYKGWFQLINYISQMRAISISSKNGGGTQLPVGVYEKVAKRIFWTISNDYLYIFVSGRLFGLGRPHKVHWVGGTNIWAG